MSYSKGNTEKAAVRCYLRNEGIDFDDDLFSLTEENSITDATYAGIKYQVTTPPEESSVVGQIINSKKNFAKGEHITGSQHAISEEISSPMFTGEHTPSDTWKDFVIDPISNKRHHDGRGITLLIFVTLLIPPFLTSGDAKVVTSGIPSIPQNNFDKIVLVDSHNNVHIK